MLGYDVGVLCPFGKDQGVIYTCCFEGVFQVHVVKIARHIARPVTCTSLHLLQTYIDDLKILYVETLVRTNPVCTASAGLCYTGCLQKFYVHDIWE